MNYNGKVVKKILRLYPDNTLEEAIKKFFDYYYTKCGLSSTEIAEYILNTRNKNNTTVIMMAKTFGIEMGIKGGNHFKYDRYYICNSCNTMSTLRLLIKNKDKHNNLELKCNCGGNLIFKNESN